MNVQSSLFRKKRAIGALVDDDTTWNGNLYAHHKWRFTTKILLNQKIRNLFVFG